jgi:peptidoglycan/xylan/chitin deacetylase (PgdA/CDA1 family)
MITTASMCRSHCWDHVDYTTLGWNELIDNLHNCRDTIAQLFGERPTVFYPPWNKCNDTVANAARVAGLELSYNKCTLADFLKGSNEHVINFHYWADECKDLDAALRKFTNT